MDGLTRLTPQTRTPDREGKTLKAILEEDTFRKSALLVRWSNPGQCFIHGDMYEAQLARCAWILERALVLPDRGIGQDGYNTYIGIVRKLASQYEKRSSVSEPPNAGKDDQLEVDWESDIVAIKKLSEGSLNVSESQWSFLVPNFDFQEYYRPAAGRKETSAPEGTANKKRKKPEAKAVAASPVAVVPVPNSNPPPAATVVPLQATSPAALVPLPNMEYDYAPLPDGTAVMLWSEYVDADGAVREVPFEGRPGYRPSYGPLAPGWKRAVVVDGVELVATQIQCGWARLRKL